MRKDFLGFCWAVTLVCAVCAAVIFILIVVHRVEPYASLVVAAALIFIPYVFTQSVAGLLSADKDEPG
jgi:hypothetical protein